MHHDPPKALNRSGDAVGAANDLLATTARSPGAIHSTSGGEPAPTGSPVVLRALRRCAGLVAYSAEPERAQERARGVEEGRELVGGECCAVEDQDNALSFHAQDDESERLTGAELVAVGRAGAAGLGGEGDEDVPESAEDAAVDLPGR